MKRATNRQAHTINARNIPDSSWIFSWAGGSKFGLFVAPTPGQNFAPHISDTLARTKVIASSIASVIVRLSNPLLPIELDRTIEVRKIHEDLFLLFAVNNYQLTKLDFPTLVPFDRTKRTGQRIEQQERHALFHR